MKKRLTKTIDTSNKIVDTYISKTKGLEPLKELRKFKSLLPKNAIVLDAGCGWGRDSKILSNDFKVIGIDLSNNLLSYAKEYAPKVIFKKSDVTNAGLKTNTFDGLWSNVVLLYLEREDVLPVLKDFYRILKRGGVAYILVKEGEGFEYKSEDMSGEKPRFYTLFTKKEFEKYLKQAGFSTIEIYIFSEKRRLGLKRDLGVINCFVRK